MVLVEVSQLVIEVNRACITLIECYCECADGVAKTISIILKFLDGNTIRVTDEYNAHDQKEGTEEAEEYNGRI